MENASPSTWDQWLTRLIVLPDDDEETIIYKKVWCELASSAFVLGAALLIVSMANRFHALSFLAGVFTLYFLVAGLLSFRIKKHIHIFFYVSEVFKILISFCFVAVTGGILHSGGLVLVGMAGVFFALVFPKPEKVWFLLVLYLGTITTEALLQPHFVPMVQFPPSLNLVLFVLTLSAFVLTLFSFLHTFFKERARFRKLETEKLRALDVAKNHFFVNISHEFRTPLTVILGMADQLREGPARQAGEEARLIRRNGRKLLRLVDQLLDLSKLEAGSLPAKYVQADVVMEMKYLLESYHSLADAKEISLQFFSDPGEFWMDIDPEKLENVVGNLLDNAIKYTPERGAVRLHLQLLPAHLLIRVEDTGIGIPPRHWEKIFSRFYRVGEWPTEGAGVGLAIVREYVKLLDGHIELDSRPGEGSAFSLYLPVRNNAPRRVAEPDARLEELEQEDGKPVSTTTAAGTKPQLLIVEDNPDVVHYLENLLRANYRLQVARDGEEGIGMAIGQVPDIIISDIMMPKKDGLEVCQTLKNDVRTNHIPIVLLTAKADIASRISGLEAGADAYLAKPFNRQELEVELAKLLRLRELLRQKYRQPAESASTGKPLGLNERFLRDVQQCLERHYPDENFGIKALYSMLGISPTQLHRKLIALTGMAASQYIRSFRLEKAKDLLRTTRMTVAEVAFAVGFRDPLYFSRVFSRHFGPAPSEARG